MRICEVFPARRILSGVRRELVRQRSQVKFRTGPVVRRTLWTRPKVAVTADLLLLAADYDEFERAINRHSDGSTVWLPDPAGELEHDRVLTGVGDGTKTTWTLPVVAGPVPADLAVYVDGARQDPSGYTVHPRANLLTDEQASMEAGTLFGLSAFGSPLPTLTPTGRYTAHGRIAALVTPTGSTDQPRLRTDPVVVTAGRTYTGLAVEWSAGVTVQVRVNWYGDMSGTSYLDGVITLADATIGVPNRLAATGTADASAVTARVLAGNNDTSTTVPVVVDALGLMPGDLTDWWLPSEAPPVLEFNAPIADGAVIEVKFTGQRLIPCALDLDKVDRIVKSGHCLVRGIRFEEVWI